MHLSPFKYSSNISCRHGKALRQNLNSGK